MSAPVMAGVRLTLGPLLYNWSADRRRDFYFRLADEAPYDAVHLGEVVCAKRQPFLETHLDEIIGRLTAAGKQVVLSSLMLVTSRQERQSALALAELADSFMIEANDIGVAAALAGRPFAVGPLVNVYNEGTLDRLAAMGAARVCLPAELPAASIRTLARGARAEIEIQAFGRLPLAISSRCYHARLHGLHKDGCQFVCGKDADGLAVRTLDETPFLAINGTQTLSHHYALLSGETAALAEAGVSHLRLWPHDCDMAAVGEVFRGLLDGGIEPGAAAQRLGALVPGAEFANGFFHGREGAALV